LRFARVPSPWFCSNKVHQRRINRIELS
jgi:hypothetical protein